MLVKIFEDFTSDLKDIKHEILKKAIQTDDLNVVKTFVERGYDINGDDILDYASYDDAIFRYMLSKNPDIKYALEDHSFKMRIRNFEVQKALIDFGYENLIYDTVGFNSELKHDPKYSNVVDMFNQTSKYNL